MRLSRPLTAALFAMSVLAVIPVGALGSPRSPGRFTPAIKVEQALAAFTSDTAAAPGDLLPAERAPLRASAARALRLFRVGRECSSLRTVGALRDSLRAAPFADGFEQRTRIELDADLVNAHIALITRGGTKACGGGLRTAGAAPLVQVPLSSARRVLLHVVLPLPRAYAHTNQGHTYLDISQPGLDPLTAPGTPNVSQLTRFLAVPTGASIDSEVVGFHAFSLPRVTLYPQQDAAVDAAGAPDPPFVADQQAYAIRTFEPPNMASSRLQGRMRDLRVGSVSIAGSRVRARTRELQLLTSVDVRVTFPHASSRSTFGPRRVTSVWELASAELYAATFLNYRTAIAHLAPNPGHPNFCGAELLVITPEGTGHAVDEYVDARTAMGYLVKAVEMGSGPGDAGITSADLADFIHHELTDPDCSVHPSFVTLFSAPPYVPTATPDNPWATPAAGATIGSDIPYVLVGGDLIPDAAIGRDIAPMSRFLSYTTDPPMDAAYYQRAALVASFRADPDAVPGPGADTRSYIRTAEAIRSGLVRSGKLVDRIYATSAAAVDPAATDDASPLPAGLLRPVYPWDADGPSISAAWNEGRFLIIHRGPSTSSGWDSPSFGAADMDNMTDYRFPPVVLAFDSLGGVPSRLASPNFASHLAKTGDGGAVGVLASSTESPSDASSAMALGVLDAIFPATLAGEGPAAPITRMGLALNAGNVHVDAAHGPGSPTGRAARYGYQWFGDPSMPLWTSAPRQRAAVTATAGDVNVTVSAPGAPDGTAFTLVSKYVGPIGRALSRSGRAVIVPDSPFAFRDGAFVAGSVAGVPYRGAYVAAN